MNAGRVQGVYKHKCVIITRKFRFELSIFVGQLKQWLKLITCSFGRCVNLPQMFARVWRGLIFCIQMFYLRKSHSFTVLLSLCRLPYQSPYGKEVLCHSSPFSSFTLLMSSINSCEALLGCTVSPTAVVRYELHKLVWLTSVTCSQNIIHITHSVHLFITQR